MIQFITSKAQQPNQGANVNNIESIGLIGSVLTSLSFFPQVIKSWQSRDTSGVSIWNPLVGLLSGVFWLVYAVSLNIMPVLVSTIFIGTCNIALIFMKLIYDRNNEAAVTAEETI